GPGSVPRHELTDDLKRLLTCIGRLEPGRQRMLLLAYYGAFSRDQLSAKLDMPVDLLSASLRRSLLDPQPCLKSSASPITRTVLLPNTCSARSPSRSARRRAPCWTRTKHSPPK